MAAYTDAEWCAVRDVIVRGPFSGASDTTTKVLEAITPAITARAKAEALREFAALTRGPSKDLRDVGTCLSIALDAEVLAELAEAGIEW